MTEPTTHDQALLAAMTLSMVSGIGPRMQSELLAHFGSAAAILSQSRDVLLSVNGVGPKLADNIRAADFAAAAEMLDRCRQLNVTLLQRDTDDYPARLATVDDAPSLLYCRGELLPRDDLAVAIVGSRRCTAYGRKQAERLAGSLARAGFTIISGLARGIDAAAHRGALCAGGRTIAVLATGVNNIYPPEHADLANELLQKGALVSEFPLDQRPLPGLFPQRNRIISGLSLGVIIVEATRNSGALYTARHALEQGREVFAVPGHVDSLASEGCHDLIRDGVTLIRNVDDVMKELGPLATPANPQPDVVVHNPREMTLNPQELEILNVIATSPVHVDEVMRATKLDPSRVLSTLTVLEMRRFIRRLPGNMLIRNS
ncbi:MAG: DNA-processing protein DprA [Planctomycetaceae bacterium]